jgi:hypothetical protein
MRGRIGAASHPPPLIHPSQYKKSLDEGKALEKTYEHDMRQHFGVQYHMQSTQKLSALPSELPPLFKMRD